MSRSDAAAPWQHRLPEVLRQRNFLSFYTGQALSQLGDAILPVALAFAVLDISDSPSALGLVLAAGFLPGVLFLLIGGVLADRVQRRRLMIVCDVVRFGSQLTQGVLVLTGEATLVSLVVLQLVWGTAAAFFRPASTGIVAEMVEPGRLTQANSLIALSDSIAYTVGPAIAGVIIAVASPGVAIVADGLTFAASAVALLLIRVPRADPAPARERSSLVSDLRSGWHEFSSRTWLWTMVAWGATFNVIAFPAMIVLGPVVAHEELGGASAWAVISACSGLGAIIGGVLGLRLRSRYVLRPAFLPLGFYGLPLLLLAIPSPVALIAFAAVLGGIGVTMFNVYVDTAIQQQVPLTALSGVSHYNWWFSIALVPVGPAAVGPVAELTSIPAVLVVTAAWMLISPVVLYAARDARDLRNVAEPAPATR